jgi:hypothetical protein
VQSVVIHAHFYQPPREDPWLGLVEREPSASPWHDWNERITHECYLPVSAARLHRPSGRIGAVVNLYQRISFDVGATLLAWLESHAPEVYDAIRDGDARSRARLGFGNAVAMPYHHVILPLASHRDKVTEVRWGIRDFQRRFGRDPEGMWLPETAVDMETLEVLAREGIRFTILAPHQVQPVPLHGLPAAIRIARGLRIAVFVYDGPVAHDVAFGPLLRDADAWARRLTPPAGDVRGPRLVSVATDGETYGHHHPFGELALAAVLEVLDRMPEVRVENYAAFLAAHPPSQTVALVPHTSWSCAHGLERWRSDCGCRTKPGTSQAWRAPLRAALDWLREQLDHRYEQEARALFDEPWEARDRYDPATAAELPPRARALLEMQHQARRMYSSCGWFFDDVSGLESVQLLRSAVRAIELAGDPDGTLRAGLLDRLREARSNDAAEGDAAQIAERRAIPAFPGEVRAAAGAAVLAALVPDEVPSAVGDLTLVRVTRDQVELRNRRTGTETAWHTEVHRDSVVHLAVRVAPPPHPPPAPASDAGYTLRFADLPEPVRDAIRSHWQARLVGAVLDESERERLAAGLVELRRVLDQAMLRHLGPDPSSTNVVALTAALDLLELLATPVPFASQTRFYRHYCAATPEHRRRLEPLCVRFGFEPLAHSA